MKKLIVIMLLICFSVGLFSQVTFTRKLISEERLDISTVSDFDQDGDLDIIQSYSMWMKNDGFGNFTEKELISLPDYKKHIIIDMNRDGYMDVISKPYGENYLLDTIFWYQNDGIFNFNEHMILSKIGDTGFTDAEATDLDGDGDIDVVTAGFGKDRLFWHGNDGFNNFASNIILECDTTLSYYEYSGIGGISCKDINKDGNIDIIYYTMRYVEDAKLSWLENTGNGNFVDHFIGFLSQDETKYFLKCTDINNSGDIDIIMLGWNESNFSIYENDGAGNFLVSNIQ
ncbi:MAG: VCBS repeat-containing protein, partial [Candidatus Delongbacteria bacterium]